MNVGVDALVYVGRSLTLDFGTLGFLDRLWKLLDLIVWPMVMLKIFVLNFFFFLIKQI